MDDVARIASNAIAWQRFGYVGVGTLVLMAASFSNTERRLFDGGVAPAAFAAVPGSAVAASDTPPPALPLLRSFAFGTAPDPEPAIDRAPVAPLPGQGAAGSSSPVEIASALPATAPEAVVQSPFVRTGSSTGGASGPSVGASGPGVGVLAPASAGQPTTTLPVSNPGSGGGGAGGGTGTGGGSTGTTTNPGTGTTTNPGTGTITNPGTGTTTNPGTGTTTNPGTGTGTTTNPGTGTTTNPGTGTTTNPGTGTTTNPGTGTSTNTGTGTGTGTGPSPVSPVPEPATWMTMLLGFLSVGVVLRGRGSRVRRADA